MVVGGVVVGGVVVPLLVDGSDEPPPDPPQPLRNNRLAISDAVPMMCSFCFIIVFASADWLRARQPLGQGLVLTRKYEGLRIQGVV